MCKYDSEFTIQFSIMKVNERTESRSGCLRGSLLLLVGICKYAHPSECPPVYLIFHLVKMKSFLHLYNILISFLWIDRENEISKKI